MSNLADLPGLGPKSAALLADANIRNVVALRKLGAVQAFLAVKHRDPRVSLNLLWALEGALSTRHWQDVARKDRVRLLIALDDAIQNSLNRLPAHTAVHCHPGAPHAR